MRKPRLINTLFISSVFLSAAIFLFSCKTVQTAVDYKDLSYIYNPTKNPVTPEYLVTNESDTRSVLHVKFNASELFFSEANPTGKPISEMVITAKLFNTSQGRSLADTAHYTLSIEKVTGKKQYIYDIPLNVEKGMDYLAEVKILDRLRLLVMQAFIPFNTSTDLNRYNFAARDYFDMNLMFSPVIRKDKYVNLRYLRNRPDSLFISFYKPFRQVPDPPSMLLPQKTLDYKPDTIVPIAYTDSLPMMFPKEGVFMCTTGRDTSDGYAFFNFGRTYPGMNSPETMIEPLIYLSNPDEIEQIRTAARPKVALDDFWMKCANNVDKARELIRIYYTRVQFANIYFSSFAEGWRTERGMIYIIYGPPDKVYKNSEGESWGYRKPVMRSSWGTRYRVREDYLYFTFKKRDNRFTDNDYYLSRNESLVTYWDQAVACWKKGIVFRLDNPEEF